MTKKETLKVPKAQKPKKAVKQVTPAIPNKKEQENIQKRANWVQKKIQEACAKAGVQLMPVVHWEATGARPDFAFQPIGEGTLEECIEKYNKENPKVKE